MHTRPSAREDGGPDVVAPRQVLDTLEEVYYFLSPSGDLLQWNDRVPEVTGYAHEEIEEMAATDFFGPEDSERVANAIATVVTERQEVTVEADYLTKSGDRIPYEFSGTPIVEDGELLGVVGVGREITERREREAKLQQISENVNEVVWMSDPDKESMEFVTEAYEEVWGRPTEELYAAPTSFVDAIHPDDREDVRDALERQRTNPESYDETYRVVQPDGEVRWVRDQAAGVYDDDGSLDRIVGVARDVTEQRERERKYRRLTERISDAYYAVDTDWQVTYWNDVVAERQGIPADDILGDDLWERFPEVEGSVVEDTLREAMETQEQASCEYYYEPDEYWVHLQVYPDPEGLTILSRDVTERKRQERRLRETKQRLNFALEGTDTGIWEWNVETDEVVWNEMTERLFGIEPGSFEGTFEAFAEYVHPEDLPQVEADVQQALESGEMYQSAFRVQRADGEQIWTEARGQLVSDEDGTERMVGIITDVTERKEYERRLERSNERLEQFAYVASHDLQEPLRTVANFAGILEKEYGDRLDEEGRDYLERVVTAAERMESMINALLDYSRVTTRGGDFQRVDAEAVVEDVVADLAVLAEECDGTVEYEPLPTVEADPDQLRQVFQNLVTNALEHSGEEPVTVSVDATRVDGGYRFAVADDGPGIEPDRQDDVFRMFDSTEQDYTTGQVKGVGLAVCDNIVRRHGGDIWVESEPGDGATFYFTADTSGGK